MPDKERDRWDKFDIATKAVAGILLPVMILLVGNWYTSQQQKANEERLQHEKEAEIAQRNADRVSSFLVHLASNNAKERKLCLEVLGYLARNNQMPDELLTPLISTVNDQDEEVASAGATALSEVAMSSPDNAKSIVKATEQNPKAEESVVKAAKSDPDLARSVVTASESLKNEPTKTGAPPDTKRASYFDRLVRQIKVTDAAIRAELVLISDPPGAKVSLAPSTEANDENKYQPKGMTPVTVRVAPGAYMALFESNGRKIKEMCAAIAGQKSQVKVVFQ